MLRGSWHQPRREDSGGQVLRVRGQAQCERLHAAVPLWSLLRLPEAEGTGNELDIIIASV